MRTPRIRGPAVSRQGAEYGRLLTARSSLQEAHDLSRKPQLRALAATAISRIDAVLDLIEGRSSSSAKPATPALLALERDVVRLRRPSVRPADQERPSPNASPHLLRSAKYTQETIDALGKQGKAWTNPDGSFSHPIADEGDVKAAVAAATGNAALKSWITAQAKKLQCMHLLPSSWA